MSNTNFDLNVSVKETNALADVNALDVEKAEEIIDDDKFASAADCAAAAKTARDISQFYADAAKRLDKAAFDRAAAQGYSCDMKQATLSLDGQCILMSKVDDPTVKVWVRVFPNSDWFNVKKANSLVRATLFNALKCYVNSNSSQADAVALLDLLETTHILTINPSWDYNAMNNSKVNNKIPDFIKNCETQNLYENWTLFGPRADEIKESDIRPYDGQSSLLTVDLTFII